MKKKPKKNQPISIRHIGLKYDLQDAFPTQSLAQGYAEDLRYAGDLSIVRYLGPGYRLKYGVYSVQKRKTRKNPVLAIMGNPKGKLISTEVIEIRYIHEKDNDPYKHKFEYKGTKMLAMPDGSIRIYNPKHRLWGNF